MDGTILKEYENKLVIELLESAQLEFDKEAMGRVIGLLNDKQPQLRKRLSKNTPNNSSD